MKRKNELPLTSQPEKKIKIGEEARYTFQAIVRDFLTIIDFYKNENEWNSIDQRLEKISSAIVKDNIVKSRLNNYLEPLFATGKADCIEARNCIVWSAKYDKVQLLQLILELRLEYQIIDANTVAKVLEAAFENNCTNTKALLCNDVRLRNHILYGDCGLMEKAVVDFIIKAIESGDLERVAYAVNTPLAALFPDKVMLLDRAQSKSKEIARFLEEEIRADFKRVSQAWGVDVIPCEITSGWIENYKKVIALPDYDAAKRRISYNYLNLTQNPGVLFIANNDLDALRKLSNNKKDHFMPRHSLWVACRLAEVKNDFKTGCYFIENRWGSGVLTGVVCDMFSDGISSNIANSPESCRDILMQPSLDWENVLSAITNSYPTNFFHAFYNLIPVLAKDNCVLFHGSKYVKAIVKLITHGSLEMQGLGMSLMAIIRQNDALNREEYATIMLSTIVSLSTHYIRIEYCCVPNIFNPKILNMLLDCVKDFSCYINPAAIKQTKIVLDKHILHFKTSSDPFQKEIWNGLSNLIGKYKNRPILHKYMLFCHHNQNIGTPGDVVDQINKQYVEEILPYFIL